MKCYRMDIMSENCHSVILTFTSSKTRRIIFIIKEIQWIFHNNTLNTFQFLISLQKTRQTPLRTFPNRSPSISPVSDPYLSFLLLLYKDQHREICEFYHWVLFLRLLHRSGYFSLLYHEKSDRIHRRRDH